MVSLAELANIFLGVLRTPEFWFWFATYAVIALSLNLEAGLTGIPNFGRHLAVVVGAIVAAALPGYLSYALLPQPYKQEILSIAGTKSLPPYAGDYNSLITSEINKYFAANPAFALVMFLLTLIVAAVVGALTGYLAAYPAARLKEDYLAITLLAAGEAVLVIAYNAGSLGGTQGMSVPNTLEWLDKLLAGPLGSKAHQVATMIMMVLAAAVVLVYLELAVRSPLGRLLKGVRENEVASEAVGKDTAKVKLKTLMLGSAVAAVAGALYIMATLGWIATAYDRITWTFWPWAMMILGGAGNNLGVVVGSFILTYVYQFITYNQALFKGHLPFSPAWLHYLVLGLVLVLVLMLKPEGLLPEKTTYPLPRRKLEEIAVKHGAPREKKATADKAALEEEPGGEA